VTSASSAQRGDAAWAALLTTSVLYFFSTNEADNDLWGHLLFGRDILASRTVPGLDAYAYTTGGHAWVNHEWLSQVVLAAVYQWAGSPGLLLLKLAIAALTCVCLFTQIRRRSRTAVVWGGVGLLTIAVLARGFAIRPQIFTYCGVALTLALLDGAARGHRGRLWALPALFLVWANLHGGFVLGVAIVGLYCVAESVREPRRCGRAWLVLGASVALAALNPNGPRLLVYIVSEMTRAHPITEWQPAAASDAAQRVFFAMLGLFVLTLPFARWREDGWRALLAFGIGCLALRQQRHTPVFALCAAAPLAAQLDGTFRWIGRRSTVTLSPTSERLLAVALALLALLQVTFTATRYARDGLQLVFDADEYPTAAVRALQWAGVHANLAVPLEWGEYALWFLAPQIKVSLDGRFATVFSAQVVDDNFDFFAGAAGWRRLLDAYPTEAALVPADSPCPIATLPGWRLVFDSAVARVYARPDTPAWQELQRLGDLRMRPVRRGIFP